MDSEKLKQLQIKPEAKRRSNTSTWAIFLLVFLCTATAVFFAWPRDGDNQRVASGSKDGKLTTSTTDAKKASPAPAPSASSASPSGSVLTVSGYIIARERIELSPRFMGVVKWIGVKKGDAVQKGQVVVRLDDAENKARLAEAESRIASAQSAVATAKLAVPETEARQAQADTPDFLRLSPADKPGRHAQARRIRRQIVREAAIDAVLGVRIEREPDTAVGGSRAGNRVVAHAVRIEMTEGLAGQEILRCRFQRRPLAAALASNARRRDAVGHAEALHHAKGGALPVAEDW